MNPYPTPCVLVCQHVCVSVTALCTGIYCVSYVCLNGTDVLCDATICIRWSDQSNTRHAFHCVFEGNFLNENVRGYRLTGFSLGRTHLLLKAVDTHYVLVFT